MRRVLVTVVAVLAVGVATAPAISAQAVQVPQPTLVSPTPVNYTPAVNNGAVRAIAQVGNTIVLGGTFTSVTSHGSTTALVRNSIVAFDASTGVVSSTFVPNLDGPVDALVPAPDGQSVYVGGEFGNVNGVKSKSLTELSVASGTKVPAFNTVAMNGNVLDMKLSGGRLWIGGNFSQIAGHTQNVLATVNATTGAYDTYMSLPFAGLHNGGTTALQKMDISPDGSKLVAIGNFTSVAGVAHDQVVMLDLTGPSAALANWTTTLYTASCSRAFDSYMRDLDISPDGRYMVISTTGAYGGSASPCDSTTRWEMNTTGTATPTWMDNTGGDTTYAVAITGTAVYTGGHFRWQNNSFAGDKAAAGAVARTGIAALDPANGLPLNWNPGRTRGVGVFDLLATSTGLWIGSDTTKFDGLLRPRIAFVPLAGGQAVPSTATQSLPGQIFLGGATGDSMQTRTFSGTAAGATTTVSGGGLHWGSSRGAVYINGVVYAGWSDGNLYSMTFDGSTFGPQVAVKGMDTIVPLTAFHTDVPNMTSMFFDSGRLYFTLNGSSSLFYRYFTPSTNVIGAVRYTATNTSTANFANASAMFLSGGTLYVGDRTTGNLRSVAFANGVASGTATTVSGPTVDGQSWNARSVFVAPQVVNKPPVAQFSAQCTALSCTFNGGASSDPDGSITSYAWTFGDGGTATGATATHSFSAAGSYPVTLTVTDNGGLQGAKTTNVSVTTHAAAIGFIGAANKVANAGSVSVTTPSGTVAGNGLVLVATAAKNTVTMTPPTGWALVSSGSTSGALTQIWQNVATAGSAGSAVKVTLSAAAKVSLTLGVYSGTDPTSPISAASVAVETVKRATHTTPTLTTGTTGGWVLSYWADDSSATTGWSLPGGLTSRSAGAGTGGGHISSVLADAAGPLTVGSVGGIVGTANSASAKATMATIVLAPAP